MEEVINLVENLGFVNNEILQFTLKLTAVQKCINKPVINTGLYYADDYVIYANYTRFKNFIYEQEKDKTFGETFNYPEYFSKNIYNNVFTPNTKIKEIIDSGLLDEIEPEGDLNYVRAIPILKKPRLFHEDGIDYKTVHCKFGDKEVKVVKSIFYVVNNQEFLHNAVLSAELLCDVLGIERPKIIDYKKFDKNIIGENNFFQIHNIQHFHSFVNLDYVFDIIRQETGVNILVEFYIQNIKNYFEPIRITFPHTKVFLPRSSLTGYITHILIHLKLKKFNFGFISYMDDIMIYTKKAKDEKLAVKEFFNCFKDFRFNLFDSVVKEKKNNTNFKIEFGGLVFKRPNISKNH